MTWTGSNIMSFADSLSMQAWTWFLRFIETIAWNRGEEWKEIQESRRTSNHIWGQRGHRERLQTTVHLLGKQQEAYKFNVAKVTEMRNLALLHLSLCVCCYTPSHSLIHLIKLYSHLINHFIKLLNSSAETLQHYSNFFLFFFFFIVDKSVVTGNVCRN